jgi:hypothetical protein
MLDSKVRFLASAFLDAASIGPDDAELMTEILTALGDKRFMPIPAFEEIAGRRVPRIAFNTPNDGWRIVLASKRFDVALHPTTRDSANMGDFKDFLTTASEKLTTLLSFFQRRAHRLVSAQEGLLADFGEQGMNAIAGRLFIFPGHFAKCTPFEWDWRVASVSDRTFGERTEAVNTVFTAKRLRGKVIGGDVAEEDEPEFDRIRVDVDINTAPTNKRERFESTDVADFLTESNTWHAEIATDFQPIWGKLDNPNE